MPAAANRKFTAIPPHAVRINPRLIFFECFGITMQLEGENKANLPSFTFIPPNKPKSLCPSSWSCEASGKNTAHSNIYKTTHTGKIPKRSGGQIELRQRIIKMRKVLSNYVVNEEYEEAAKLRDEIKALEKELSSEVGREHE